MSEWGFWYFWLRGILPGWKGSTGTALNIQLTCIPRLHWRALTRADTNFIYFTPPSVLLKPSTLKQPWSALFFLLLQCGDEIQGGAGATNANSSQQSDSITKILHWPTTHTIKPLWNCLMIQISYSRADTAGVSTQSTYSILSPRPCSNRQCNGMKTSFVNIRWEAYIFVEFMCIHTKERN